MVTTAPTQGIDSRHLFGHVFSCFGTGAGFFGLFGQANRMGGVSGKGWRHITPAGVGDRSQVVREILRGLKLAGDVDGHMALGALLNLFAGNAA